VANQDDQTISQVDPTSLSTLRNVSLSGPPTGLAASANAIWVTESNGFASTISVASIDPQFDTVGPATQFASIAPGDSGSVAAQGNTVWVAPSSGLLSRLNAADGRVERRIDPNSGPSAIALGDGAVWMTDSEANNVTRVDPSGRTTSIAVGNGPSGIAVAASGGWVADSLDDTLVRINPSTNSITARIRVGRAPAGVAAGEGSIWVANSGDGTISRVDPRTGKVLATIVVGGSPQAITVADGRAWVTVDASTTEPSAGPSGGTLRITSQIDVDSMDPARAYAFNSYELLYAVCAKLLNYPDRSGPAGTRLIPEVAQSLPARSRDGRTYTFTIRSGFRFSSNLPVTAQTFKYTIERTLNPRMHSPVAHYLTDVVGAVPYMAGKTDHISGVVAEGDTLTIHLLRAVPDFPSRIALPAFCAVPPDMPIDPAGVRTFPSAGPYYLSSYAPGQGVVLARNPNYHGSRPHRFARIEYAVGVSAARAAAHVKTGITDYASLYGSFTTNAQHVVSQLAARYGPESRAAARGSQQYFVNPLLSLDYFVLNTHRPLLASSRMREAVNFAVDRQALAQFIVPFPDHPTDHYLPPGIPGYSQAQVYPLTGDPAKAKALAGGVRRTAVLYTCAFQWCREQAQALKHELRAMGLRVEVHSFSLETMFHRIARPGEPFDLAFYAWFPDYPDPGAMLADMLGNSAFEPPFDDPAFQRRLAAAGQLSGPQRFLAYGKLDLALAHYGAPLLAYGNEVAGDFFSARIGCQSYGVYGMDIDALCIRSRAR
jgi:YVTN family beta-propeller protein